MLFVIVFLVICGGGESRDDGGSDGVVCDSVPSYLWWR